MSSFTMKIHSAMDNVKSISPFHSQDGTGARCKNNNRSMTIFAAAMFCAVMPLEISHLIAALVGAMCYFALETLNRRVQDPRIAKPKQGKTMKIERLQKEPSRERKTGNPQQQGKPSVAPVSAPSFGCVGFQAEVNELLCQIGMTKEGEQVMANLTRHVKGAIMRTIPEAEVAAYASGNFLNGAAFGVAVPEIDVVISINPVIMQRRFLERMNQSRAAAKDLDVRKLQKSAIRACTDQLVATGIFKFRRSGFRGAEPRVTLLARLTRGQEEVSVPLTISVNSATPMHSAALITECGQKDMRAQGLMLLVRRWAKDRGISHVAQGHLSPYAWTLLTMYFLQVDGGEGGPVLPALDAFKISAGNAFLAGKQRAVQPPQRTSNHQSVAELFKGFVAFYAQSFGWDSEGVSVVFGRRDAPNVCVPLHIIVHDDGKTTSAGPSVEDPFEVGSNLADAMTIASLERLRAELHRAHKMCSQDASLTELLEPWVPPEALVAAGKDK